MKYLALIAALGFAACAPKQAEAPPPAEPSVAAELAGKATTLKDLEAQHDWQHETGEKLNAAWNEGVKSILGKMSRPDAIKLPWLLTVAQDETNPRAPDAVYLLQALLGQDNGKDWGQWAASVDRYLQTGPE